MSHTTPTVEDLINQRPGFSEMQPANQTQAIAINDFIYMSKGTSNAYMVVTDVGRVIINTGMGFEALTHKKIFDAVYPGPTHYILLTQGHVDHVGGVKQFREPQTQLVAQKNNAQCQRDDERISTIRSSQAYIWFKKTFDQAASIAQEHPDVFVQDKPTVDIPFNESYRFKVGEIEFEMISTPGGETIDSAIVWLPQFRICFSGNVFGPLFPHFPNINTIRGDKYRFIEPYLETVETVRKLQPELLITGHFDPVSGKQLINDSLQRLYASADYVHTETLKGMNDDKDIFTLMRDIQLPDHLVVGQGYGKVSWAVRTLWESYMGWFKAQSTSELYPTQVQEIYQDLVDLAGIDRIINCGQKKLGQGKPEAALHFAQIALTKDEQNNAAIRLSLAAHQQIQCNRTSKNFWEDGWLNHQIHLLQTRLDEQGAR
jgi:alkyl sulfatase BDS1-like metallo-beta-lactamase superfamily hydrolase